MNFVKVNGTKPERIIGGKRYIRTDRSILAIRDFNSYVGANMRAYDQILERAYDRLTEFGIDKDNFKVFAEIVKKGANKLLYLTIFKEDKSFINEGYKRKTIDTAAENEPDVEETAESGMAMAVLL